MSQKWNFLLLGEWTLTGTVEPNQITLDPKLKYEKLLKAELFQISIVRSQHLGYGCKFNMWTLFIERRRL